MAHDVEVTITPARSSRQNEFDLCVRSVIDRITNVSWTKSDLTNANLRKIADAIYAHLGIELSDEVQDMSTSVTPVDTDIYDDSDYYYDPDEMTVYEEGPAQDA